MEYRVAVVSSPYRIRSIQELLDEFANNGWRLVCTNTADDGCSLLLFFEADSDY